MNLPVLPEEPIYRLMQSVAEERLRASHKELRYLSHFDRASIGNTLSFKLR